MDPERLQRAWEQISSLDERMTYKIRPKPGGPMLRPDPDRLEGQLRDLAGFTLELKEILHDVILALGTRAQGEETKPSREPGK